MKKCVNCKYFQQDGVIKGKKAYYCGHTGRFKYTDQDFICYGHPTMPIITRAPKWCPILQG